MKAAATQRAPVTSPVRAFRANWHLPLDYPEPRAPKRVWAWECLRRNERYAEAFATRPLGAAERFGVRVLIDPWGDDVPHFTRTCAAVVSSWRALPASDVPRLVVAFDPRLPTEEQLASATRWTRAQLAAWHRAHPDQVHRARRLPSHSDIVAALRVSDAYAAGATRAQVADVLILTERERYCGVSAARVTSARRKVDRLATLAAWLIAVGHLELALRDEFRAADITDLALSRSDVRKFLFQSRR